MGISVVFRYKHTDMVLLEINQRHNEMQKTKKKKNQKKKHYSLVHETCHFTQAMLCFVWTEICPFI